jgi:hypothetical protein
MGQNVHGRVVARGVVGDGRPLALTTSLAQSRKSRHATDEFSTGKHSVWHKRH